MIKKVKDPGDGTESGEGMDLRAEEFCMDDMNLRAGCSVGAMHAVTEVRAYSEENMILSLHEKHMSFRAVIRPSESLSSVR